VDAPLPVIDEKYQLVRKLGEGGMGAVYEARHQGTGRRVAVKLLASAALEKRPEVVQRFQREAMASGAVESQYIAQVFDSGVDAKTGSPYTVMELLVGEDLSHAIKRLGPLPPDVALRVCAQACMGLRKAHEAGVIHRDIKPANLFLATREEGEVLVKLLDFGIAKIKVEVDPNATTENGALTRTGALLGSPLYMSPEQARGRKEIDHRTDIWSLGVVLYEALTGVTPYGHLESFGELLIQICSTPPRHVQDLAPWVPADAAAIVHTALALNADRRFAGAAEMLDALRGALGSGPSAVALHASMFVALPAETKSLVVTRLDTAASLREPLKPSLRPPSEVASDRSVHGGSNPSSTVDGATAASVSPMRMGTGPRNAVLVAVAVAAAGLGAWGLTRSTSPAPTASAAPVETAAATAAAAPTPVTLSVAPPGPAASLEPAVAKTAEASGDAGPPATHPSAAPPKPNAAVRPPPPAPNPGKMHMEMKE
jgi:serine/threonine-protein kinase